MNKEKLYELLMEELHLPGNRIFPKARLDEEYGLNSFELYGLAVKIEELFDMEISGEVLEDLQTIEDLENLVAGKEE